jgi:hypothetical protein
VTPHAKVALAETKDHIDRELVEALAKAPGWEGGEAGSQEKVEDQEDRHRYPYTACVENSG